MTAWIVLHHLAIGVIADSLTFLGAVLLARDAFVRLDELKKKRGNEQFRERFKKLNLTDKEWKRAVFSVRCAITGFCLLTFGFLMQIVLRLNEPTR